MPRFCLSITRSGEYSLTHIFAKAYIQHMDAQPVFDALADATRRRILALLVNQGELCVCELTAALDDIQPKISRHLGVLKDAGIVLPRREGTWMFYRLAEPLPAWTAILLDALAAGVVPELKADLKRLKTMAGRPERCVA
jgi:ArsR family transcriptional regulator